MAYTREYLEHFHNLPWFHRKPAIDFDRIANPPVAIRSDIEPLTDEWMEIWDSLSEHEQQKLLYSTYHSV